MFSIDGQVYMNGMYEAEVVDDNDPMDLCRVKARVYALHDNDLPAKELPWAAPCHNITGNESGEKRTPNIGQVIWVGFNQGDPAHPIWIGASMEVGDPKSGKKTERLDGDSDLLIV